MKGCIQMIFFSQVGCLSQENFCGGDVEKATGGEAEPFMWATSGVY